MLDQETMRRFQDFCVAIVQSDDLRRLQSFLKGEKKNEVNTPIGKFGLTFLHLCAFFGQTEMAAWLLENKAIANKQEHFSGKTPLHLAAYYGNSDLLDLFLQRSKKTLTDQAHCLPIHYACMQGHVEIVRFLIRAGEEPNSFSSIGTPLDIAIQKKNFPLADLLSRNIGLSCLASPDDIDRDSRDFLKRNGLSPVHLAIASNQGEIAKMLLQRFPQNPSEKLKKEWDEFEFIERFFSVQPRRNLLELFYLPQEVPCAIDKIKSYIDKWRSEIPEDSPFSEILQTIVHITGQDISMLENPYSKQGKLKSTIALLKKTSDLIVVSAFIEISVSGSTQRKSSKRRPIS